MQNADNRIIHTLSALTDGCLAVFLGPFVLYVGPGGYAGIVPNVTHAGSSNLFRIDLTVEVWGNLEQIDANARKVTEALNAKRTAVGNVEFTTVCMEATDITELGLDFKRRRMRFVGLAEIGETNG